MLKEAVYSDAQRQLRVSVAREQILLQSEEILNFPRIIELEGESLVLAYGSGRHGGEEGRPVAVSDDFGATWADPPKGFPMSDNVQTSGIMGYMSDGTIAYIDVFPVNAEWSREAGPYHQVAGLDDPVFRLRRFSRTAALLEDTQFRVADLPWTTASYELYGSLLELRNGDYLTAFQAHVGKASETRHDFTTFIARSRDLGRSFECVWPFHPELDGEPVGDQGFCEPDLEVLANGDILCMMRSGSGSPLYQSRSTDGGSTWSTPECVGWPGVKPHLRLLENGVLACSTGRGLYGQPQITSALFSLDGTGATWEHPFAFHTGPGCSYTSNMERGGQFYVVYSHSSFTRPAASHGLPHQSIKWVVLDVDLHESGANRSP